MELGLEIVLGTVEARVGIQVGRSWDYNFKEYWMWTSHLVIRVTGCILKVEKVSRFPGAQSTVAPRQNQVG